MHGGKKRRTWAVAALLAAAALGPAAAGCPRTVRTPRPPPAPDTPAWTVMTYNVNFGLGGDASTIDAIRAGGADVVFLQETTPEWEDALRARLAGLYPYMAFRHGGGAGGLGVMSRLPFADVAVLAPPSGWFPAWRLRLETPLGALQALVVHLHPPVSERGSYVSGYFSTPRVRLAEIAGYFEAGDALVAGDFNEDNGGRAVEFLESAGLRSVLPEFRPGATTWRWGTVLGELTEQLDHIVYASSRLEPLDARVLDAGRSDHLPVVATFIAARRP
jgi:endonuclease/exonuclease/phosphatase (EEP) superfamily protein YafD